jgi:hypothetical protein
MRTVNCDFGWRRIAIGLVDCVSDIDRHHCLAVVYQIWYIQVFSHGRIY